MTETLVIMLLIGAVLVVTAVVFAIWLAAGILRLLVRGVTALFQPEPVRTELPDGPTMVCPRSGCNTVNPVSAKFCRRCGQELLKRQARYRTAALW